MKNRKMLLPVAALTLAASCSLGCVHHTHYGSVEGVVTDVSDGTPIAGAAVVMSNGSARTDATGRFRLAQIETGTRSATVTAAGYQTAQKSVAVQDSRTSQVAVALAPGPDPHQGTMRATIDGRQWEATQHEANVAAAWLPLASTPALLISGINDDAFNAWSFGLLGLVLYGPLDSFHPGTYPVGEAVEDGAGGLTGGTAGFLALGTGSNWGTNAAHGGTVTISRFDIAGARIEGTFSFDAVTNEGDTLRTARNGSFSCPLDVNPSALSAGIKRMSERAGARGVTAAPGGRRSVR